MFYHRDPRRYQALVVYIIEEFHLTDYNGESSLNAVKSLSFYRAFYEEESWKFSAWADEAIDRVWPEISSEHDEVGKCHCKSGTTHPYLAYRSAPMLVN